MNTTIITSWLLTYLVHSTILLGAAWLASRIWSAVCSPRPCRSGSVLNPSAERSPSTALEGRTRSQPCPREMTASPHQSLLPAALFQLLPAFLIE